MSTETKSENTPTTTENNNSEIKANDNKTVFGPLGKYAVIAVIMVSIIVTTAIMLDKELNTAEDQVAVIENEVTELNKIDSVKTVSNETPVAAETQLTTEVVTSEKTPVEAPSADVLVAIEPTPKETASDSVQNTEVATAENTQASQTPITEANMDQERQARIEANKLEQKQHMAEMFTRIKKLETQQLDQYKASQDKRIERLREQIAQQQQLIDTLVLRNKEIYDLRAASVQRNQTNREQILNRI